MAVSELLLATANPHKVNEIRAILPKGYRLISLTEAGISIELPETSGTIEGNARQKAVFASELSGLNSIADDTGLIVPSLGGAPGADSAFYAGLPRDDKKNMKKLLTDLEGKDPGAYFLSVIALVMNGKEHVFEGRLYGKIAIAPSGNQGFGYDPVFVPEGETRSLAEMTAAEKNSISHRSRALMKLVDFLHNFQ